MLIFRGVCRKNPGFPLQSYDLLEWDVSPINPTNFREGSFGILRVPGSNPTLEIPHRYKKWWVLEKVTPLKHGSF